MGLLLKDKITLPRRQHEKSAMLYGVQTKVLNQAVKRNIERFPERFMFGLVEPEMRELVTNCDRFETLKHSAVRWRR